MPGIVGLITRMPKRLAEAELHRMLDAVSHEPFYVTGTWMDESLGVYLGWTAREGSSAGVRPLKSEDGDVLALSGEEYSEPGLACDFDRRVVGSSFPASLNGRFHGLLVNRRGQSATLFNDRYGLHRVYYHESVDTFYFAAETKAILAARPELRCVDERSLGEFVACGCVLENRTLFKGISVLPPASAWRCRQGAVDRRHSYFRPREWEEQSILDPEPYYEELRATFSRILPRYFGGSQRIGMSLTGGLDTRMVMAWIRPAPGSLPCYSFGSTFRDTHDVRVARTVAAACRQPFSVIPIGTEFLTRFAEFAERTIYLTDGCVGVNHSSDLYANERAREIAPIRLTGNYGGEVLRQVRAFKPHDPAPGLFRPEFSAHIRQSHDTYAASVAVHPLSFAVFRQAPWHHYGLLALEESQLALRSPYLDNDLVKTAFRAPNTVLANSRVCLRLIGDGSARLRSIPTDRGLAGQRGRLSGALSQGYLEGTFKAEYAYDYGMPQWAAPIDRHLAFFHPERLFLGRHKFTHFRLWYRTVLAGYVKEMLLDRRTLGRPYLHPSVLETMVRGHLRGNRNYTTEIHKVLTLELIHRLFLDQGASFRATAIGQFGRGRQPQTLDAPPHRPIVVRSTPTSHSATERRR